MEEEEEEEGGVEEEEGGVEEEEELVNQIQPGNWVSLLAEHCCSL